MKKFHSFSFILFSFVLTYNTNNTTEGYISQSCKFLPGTHKQLLGFSDICIEEKPKKMSYHVPIFSLLPQFEASNYFNWMMEGLTRIVKFQDMFPEAFEDGKYRMLTPQQNGGFVGETLRLLLGEKGMEKIVSLPGGVVGMKTPVHILDWQPEDSIVYKHNTFSACLYFLFIYLFIFYIFWHAFLVI